MAAEKMLNFFVKYNLEELIQAFIFHDYRNIFGLMDCNNDDLMEMGIMSFGLRKLFLDAIEREKTEELASRIERNQEINMPIDQITYSEKYTDEKFEYRHVILPPDITKLVPKNHLMTETEWRNLGVQQSPGWVHYMVHSPEPHVLLFRRTLPETQSLTHPALGHQVAAH